MLIAEADATPVRVTALDFVTEMQPEDVAQCVAEIDSVKIDVVD